MLISCERCIANHDGVKAVADLIQIMMDSDRCGPFLLIGLPMGTLGIALKLMTHSGSERALPTSFATPAVSCMLAVSNLHGATTINVNNCLRT